ncbi:MAG TPA: hypothetical protein VK512_03265 [Xanthobacteraceae bacterium]|nr:hypothetical protein [Xanthobacteraceae bacterium]
MNHVSGSAINPPWPMGVAANSATAMADRKSLNVIGLMLGAATMMVMMVGAFVVSDHVSGRLHLESGSGVKPVLSRTLNSILRINATLPSFGR